jgi:predicted nucleic acid-binding Zn ribbon protein
VIESGAFRPLAGSALKLLFQITNIWARSGGLAGNTNGKLIVTYEQFSRCWGLDSHTIAAALRQLKALGFIEVTEQGCAGNADECQPNQYRLTFLPAEGVPGKGSNEWKRIAPEDAKRIANGAYRTPGDGPCRVRRRYSPNPFAETDETGKFKIPVDACNGFHCEQSASEGVSCNEYETDRPRRITPRIYRSRPEGQEQHTNGVTGPPAPTNAQPAQAGPRHCDVCGAEIQFRRIDARFCSSRCRLRAHRQTSNSLITPIAGALTKQHP